MQEFVRQITPPLVASALKRLVSPRLRLHASYEDARAACGPGAYESEDLVRVVIEKTLIHRRQIESHPAFDLASLRTLIGLSLAGNGDRLNVLDFGGGGGYHYSIARVAFGPSRSIRWNVVETRAMVKEAQHLADGSLQFFEQVSEAVSDLGEVDLVFASSALQYVPDPLHQLKALLDIGAKHLFITRTPFIESGESLFATQVSRIAHNGPGPLPEGFADRRIAYPITFVSRAKFEQTIQERYDIRFTIEEDKAVFAAGKSMVDMYGYFCVIRNSPGGKPLPGRKRRVHR